MTTYHREAPDDPRGMSTGLEHARLLIRDGRRGRPTDDDRPPVHTFPMTRAAREALRLSRERRA